MGIAYGLVLSVSHIISVGRESPCLAYADLSPSALLEGGGRCQHRCTESKILARISENKSTVSKMRRNQPIQWSSTLYSSRAHDHLPRTMRFGWGSWVLLGISAREVRSFVVRTPLPRFGRAHRGADCGGAQSLQCISTSGLIEVG